MSIYEIHQKATKNKDIDAYAATLHNDYEFISHMDGMTMNREQAMEMFTFLMNSERITCICVTENRVSDKL